LDCNATTPLEPRVREVLAHFFECEYGNAGSRTHEYGSVAKKAVENARAQVAAVVDAKREEVFFTSGATEANNLAILGLVAHAVATGRRHVVSTKIEHKAVLEPLVELRKRGFEVELLDPTPGGWVEPDALATALRPETILVSLMHANNETGVVQPLEEVCAVLSDHDAFLHVDAAQTFGKELAALRSSRVDLIATSSHKVYGPKGIGALIARRRGFVRPPLTPLMFGGGQERGLRPGTLPVPLVVAFGAAAKLALTEHAQRREACKTFRAIALQKLCLLNPAYNGDPERTLAHTLNVTFPGVDSEAVIVALKDIVSVSNGSACTSQSYDPSHVLTAMGLPEDRVAGAVRMSWCHLTPQPDWEAVVGRLRVLIP